MKLFVIDEDYYFEDKNVEIFKFPKLYTDKDSFILNPYVDCMDDRFYFKDIKFDEIIEKKGFIYLITKNMDENYEKEVVDKMNSFYKETMINYWIETKNNLDKKINDLKNNEINYKIKYFQDMIPSEDFEF